MSIKIHLKYALENIQILIQTELTLNALLSIQSCGDSYTKYTNIIADEKERIKTILKTEVCICEDKKSGRLLIQHYQAALTNMSDDFNQLVQTIESDTTTEPKDKTEIVKIFQLVLIFTEELLTFIEKHFNCYFNLDEKIPQTGSVLLKAEFTNHLSGLTMLYKKSQIDPRLTAIMLEPFNKFINEENQARSTYREVEYLKTLHKEYSKILIAWQNEMLQINIIDQLLYLNFNKNAFITYYTKIIANDISTSDSIPDQIQQLAWWLKIVTQVRTRPEMAYKTKHLSAKEQVLNWIIAEITFLEKKQLIEVVTKPQPAVSSWFPLLVQTSLSVKQAALLIRLMFDVLILKTDNKTKFLNRLAGILKTNKNEKISENNFRTRFYNIEPGAIEGVKDWLIKMLNQLNQYKSK
jgi:hypothetical protein